MMQHVRFDNVVEQVLANESKFSVNRSRDTPNIVPCFGLIFGQRGVRMLEIGMVTLCILL